MVIRLFVFVLYLLVFFFGLSLGSFLNVVICRLDTKESILTSRSHCPLCGEILKWYELIPVLSFIIQKGRCRHCGEKISWQYPLVELSTGVLFFFIAFNNLNVDAYQIDVFSIIKTVYLMTMTALLIVVFVYDLKHYLIPDQIIYPAVLISFFFVFASWLVNSGQLSNILYTFLAAVLGSGFFLFLVLVSRGKWMGMGDVKLAVLMGLFLGWPQILLALFLSFLSGAIVGLGLIAGGRKKMKSQIPFGPFLVGATILTMLYGQFLIDWYEGLFLVFF